MKKFILSLLACFMLLLGNSCTKADASEITPEIKPVEVTSVKPLNPFLVSVDSLVKVGKLKLGEPYEIPRFPGDDVTYDVNAGFSIKGNTTPAYIKANTWWIKEKYIDVTGYCYITFRHNNHEQYWVSAPSTDLTPEVYNRPEHDKGKFMDGATLFKYLDKQYASVWH